MRLKDIHKQNAVIEATIKVINEIGFSSASISKIAKEAGVSKSTIYIYYKDKEDLVVSVYYHVKERVTTHYHLNLNEKSTVLENLQTLWTNTINASSSIPELISYDIQFTNSPYYNLIDTSIVKTYAQPAIELLERGIHEDVLEEITFDIFIAFFISPALFLSSKKMSKKFIINENSILSSFHRALKTILKS
ncbi:TetR/AcrR family transcriptional regulator [Tenacibaculum aiptasiae]|uniref:TetR/AcrR family transcriptional regulator n=1 Tax=Tenacibaculum aiptasiae TaxID=426481 RepID=UPI00233018E9|nr:TetR/AcrR family transcriptional regulator [Tenacibaculum aiptasiae]